MSSERGASAVRTEKNGTKTESYNANRKILVYVLDATLFLCYIFTSYVCASCLHEMLEHLGEHKL